MQGACRVKSKKTIKIFLEIVTYNKNPTILFLKLFLMDRYSELQDEDKEYYLLS